MHILLVLLAHAYYLCRIAGNYGIVRYIMSNHCACTDYAMCAYSLAARQHNSARPYPYISAYFQRSLTLLLCFRNRADRHIWVSEGVCPPPRKRTFSPIIKPSSTRRGRLCVQKSLPIPTLFPTRMFFPLPKYAPCSTFTSLPHAANKCFAHW